MSEPRELSLPPETEALETVSQEQPPVKPVRELSQAAIASFFYGTLQLLVTMVGSVAVVFLNQTMKTFQSATGTDISGLTGGGGTESVDLAEMQKMMEELGITDPSATPSAPPTITPDLPSMTPDLSTITGSGFTPESTPFQIVPMEFLLILVTQGFGLLGLLTAFIAFRAVTKEKNGKGLAITGLISSFLSFVIAFMVALAI